jgi:TatD DNase family protein
MMNFARLSRLTIHEPTMHLIDIGANLTHESFRRDFDAVLDRARKAGVERMIVTGASRDGSEHALALAREHPEMLRATAGVHPHHAGDYGAETDALLRTLAREPEVVAVGETGLDYFRDLSPRPAQRAAFEKQLAIAAELGMPLFLHQRDAHDDFFALLKSARDRVPAAVVHCFTDDRRALFDYLDLDCHIGITGWICDERRGTHLRELVREIPADRLLLETDAPYLLPRDIRPQPSDRRNEPMYLAHICEAVARERGETPAVTAERTTGNARTFFGIEQ